MKLNRILCVLIAVTMLTTSVFAATSNVIKIDGVAPDSEITISVSYPAGHYARGKVYVIPESAMEDASEGDLSTAVYIDESDVLTSNPVFKFKMPATANGLYAVVIDNGVPGNKDNTKYFMYNNDSAAVTSKINAFIGAADPVTALSAGAADTWYIDQSDSAYVANPAAVAALTKSLAANATEGGDIADAYVVACAIVGADSDAEIMDAVNNYNDILGVNVSDAAYAKYELKVIETFHNLVAINKPATKTAVQEQFRTACALTALNEAGVESIISVLQDYNDIFVLDFNGDYINVNTLKLAEAFVSPNFQSVEQVKTKFSTTVAALKGPGTAPGGGAPSGGSGASSAVIGSDKGQEIIDSIVKVDPTFTDISGHWAEVYIEYVFESHIMNGDPIGTFRPDDAITREEWAKVVLNTFGISVEDAECSFKDVSEKDWFYPYVARAFELGIIKGISKDEFGAGLKVSRQDAMVMLNRAHSMLYDYATDPELAVILSEANLNSVTFEDIDSVSEYADEAIRKFAILKVINGYEDGTVRPNGNITRAESAKTIKALLDFVDR